MWVRSLASVSGLRIWHGHNFGVGHRCSSDLMLPWLQHRPAAPIPPLAQELPHATGGTIERKKEMAAE